MNFNRHNFFSTGDDNDQITSDLHVQILNLCKENEEQYTSESMNVPMKKRCGVGDLANITKDAMCYCTERSSSATGTVLLCTPE